MNNPAEKSEIEIKFNQENLYREDKITDLTVGAIRMLVPMKPDGTEDTTRIPLFIGQAQMMSPEGPVPLQCPLNAKTLVEAKLWKNFRSTWRRC